MLTDQTRPTIVVLANHKGGSGKSTIAMHIVLAFLKAGRRVGSIDLDGEQRSLTRYIENRMDWSHKTQISLHFPDHHCIESLRPGKTWADGSRISSLVTALATLERNQDVIVIDTAGGGGELNLFALGLADTLVTPINDSFVDLDIIYEMGAEASTLTPSRYAQSVREALEARRTVTKRRTDWIIVRNRLSPLSSRNQREVLEALESIAPKGGFRVASGLTERVVYREFFPCGLTAFDTLEASILGTKPSMSHLLARMEVRSLMNSLDLLPQDDVQPVEQPGFPTAPEWTQPAQVDQTVHLLESLT
ncbi:MAG: division plane positioning ATPase MipZ [Xanthobacteraceae bacterium]